MPDTTALITGAAGFLGSHLAERALNAGYRVIGVDNFLTGQRKNVDLLEKIGGGRFAFVEGDVVRPWSELSLPRDWLDDLRHLFHFASPASPPHYQRLALETMWVNSIGLANAMAFADARQARVVFSSTSEVYGDPQVPVQREDYRGWVNTVGPRACYDEAKRFGEALVFTHNLKHGTHHGIVRIFNTYGPRMNPDDGRVVINFLAQALRGQDLTIYGEGRQTRSFCYVDDLIDVIWTFAHQSKTVGPVNIGNDREFSILELADTVRRLVADRPLKLVHLDALVDDPQRRLPDLSLARAQLGWEPRVSLERGLQRMRLWLEKEI